MGTTQYQLLSQRLELLFSVGAEGKMSRQRGADSDKTTLLVIRRCLNVLAEIVARAPDAATLTSANSGGVDM